MRYPLTLAALAAALPLAAAPAWADTTITETGSTLILPLFKAWATGYATSHPGVTITTDGTGSAEGIAQAIAGTVEVGTSDAYLSDDDSRQHPEILDIPMAISAQTIDYNLPDLKQPLNIDGPTLAGIYDGSIRSWDDHAIAAANPGVALPHHDIVPVRRAEGSGDTFVFTQYMSFSTTTRTDDVGTTIALPTGAWGDRVGFGTTVSWPQVPGELTATGNDGMVAELAKTPYSIGYVGISFSEQVANGKLGTAAVKDYAGQFLTPTPETIRAAAASLTPRTPDDERLTLVNAPGNGCYPLINYEYAIVSTKQKDPATSAALRQFLSWAIAPDEANETYLADAHFIGLPAEIWLKSHNQIEKIR